MIRWFDKYVKNAPARSHTGDKKPAPATHAAAF